MVRQEETICSSDKPKTRLDWQLVKHTAYRYVRFIPGSTRLSIEERQMIIGDATVRVQATLQFSFARKLIYF